MASIRKKVTPSGRISWEVRLRIGGRQVSRSFRRKRDADEWANRMEIDKSRGFAVDPAMGRITVAEYLADDIAARTLAETTQETYTDVLVRIIAPTIGSTPLGQLTPDAVRRWFKEIEAEFGRAQAAKAYRMLRAACGVAVDDGVIGRNPCAIRGAGQERSAERQVLDAREALHLARVIEPRLTALILLAAFAGLRREELLGLQRDDVDLADASLTVRRAAVFVKGKRIIKAPKSDAAHRPIALPQYVVEAVRHHLDHYAEPGVDGLVFVGERGGPLSPSTLNKRYRRARADAGLPSAVTLHDLRHTSGTMSAQLGSTTREIMARLGHSTPQAAMRYQHAVEERDRELARRLDEHIEQAERPLASVADLHSERSA